MKNKNESLISKYYFVVVNFEEHWIAIETKHQPIHEFFFCSKLNTILKKTAVNVSSSMWNRRANAVPTYHDNYQQTTKVTEPHWFALNCVRIRSPCTRRTYVIGQSIRDRPSQLLFNKCIVGSLQTGLARRPPECGAGMRAFYVFVSLAPATVRHTISSRTCLPVPFPLYAGVAAPCRSPSLRRPPLQV